MILRRLTKPSALNVTPPLAEASPSSESVVGAMTTAVTPATTDGVPIASVGLPAPSTPIVYATDSTPVPNTSADQVPVPMKSASDPDLALMDILSPLARTATFVVPSVLANLTMVGSAEVWVTTVVGVSATFEMLPTVSSVTTTVSPGEPNSGRTAVMPPVCAIGPLVWARTPAGNARRPSTRDVISVAARREVCRCIRTFFPNWSLRCVSDGRRG